jgi:hypothetical protein
MRVHHILVTALFFMTGCEAAQPPPEEAPAPIIQPPDMGCDPVWWVMAQSGLANAKKAFDDASKRFQAMQAILAIYQKRSTTSRWRSPRRVAPYAWRCRAGASTRRLPTN